MDADFPDRPLIGLLLRLVYQHYAQNIDAALRQAGFGDIRPAAANVFPFAGPGAQAVDGPGGRSARAHRLRRASP